MLADKAPRNSSASSLYPSLKQFSSADQDPEIGKTVSPNHKIKVLHSYNSGLPSPDLSPIRSCLTPPRRKAPREIVENACSKESVPACSPHANRSTTSNELQREAASSTPQSRAVNFPPNGESLTKDSHTHFGKDSGQEGGGALGSVRRSILRAPRSPFLPPTTTRHPRPSVSFSKQKEIVTFASHADRSCSDGNGSGNVPVEFLPKIQHVLLSPVSERNAESSSNSTASPRSRTLQLHDVEDSIVLNRSSITGIDELFLPLNGAFSLSLPNKPSDDNHFLNGASSINSPYGSEASWALPSIDDIAKRSAHTPSKTGRPSVLSAVQSPAPIYRFSQRISLSSDTAYSDPSFERQERLVQNSDEGKTATLVELSVPGQPPCITEVENDVVSASPIQPKPEVNNKNTSSLLSLNTSAAMADDHPVFIPSALVDRCSLSLQQSKNKSHSSDVDMTAECVNGSLFSSVSPPATPADDHSTIVDPTTAHDSIQSTNLPANFSEVKSSEGLKLKSLSSKNVTFSTPEHTNTSDANAEKSLRRHRKLISPPPPSTGFHLNSSEHENAEPISSPLTRETTKRAHSSQQYETAMLTAPDVKPMNCQSHATRKSVSIPRLSLSSVRAASPQPSFSYSSFSDLPHQTKIFNAGSSGIPRVSLKSGSIKKKNHQTLRNTINEPFEHVKFNSPRTMPQLFSPEKTRLSNLPCKDTRHDTALLGARQSSNDTSVPQLNLPKTTAPLITPRTARRTVGPIKVSQGGIWERLENGADRMTPRPREFNPSEIRLSSTAAFPAVYDGAYEQFGQAQCYNRPIRKSAKPNGYMSPLQEGDEGTLYESSQFSEDNSSVGEAAPRALGNLLTTVEHSSDSSESSWADALPPIKLDNLDTPCRFSNDDQEEDFDVHEDASNHFNSLRRRSPLRSIRSSNASLLLRNPTISMDASTLTNSEALPKPGNLDSPFMASTAELLDGRRHSSFLSRASSVPPATKHVPIAQVQREKLDLQLPTDIAESWKSFSSPHFGSADVTVCGSTRVSMSSCVKDGADAPHYKKFLSELEAPVSVECSARAENTVSSKLQEKNNFASQKLLNYQPTSAQQSGTPAQKLFALHKNVSDSLKIVKVVKESETERPKPSETTAPQSANVEMSSLVASSPTTLVPRSSFCELPRRTETGETSHSLLKAYSRLGLDSSLLSKEDSLKHVLLSTITSPSAPLRFTAKPSRESRNSAAITLLPRRSRVLSTCRKSIGPSETNLSTSSAAAELDDSNNFRGSSGAPSVVPQSTSHLFTQDTKQQKTVVKAVPFPDEGVDWNICHAAQRSSLDLRYFTAPHPTLLDLSQRAAAIVRERRFEGQKLNNGTAGTPTSHQFIDTRAEHRQEKETAETLESQNVHASAFSTAADFSKTVVGVENRKRNFEDGFTPEHVAALIDWLETRSNPTTRLQDQPEHLVSFVGFSDHLESVALLRILDSIRHDPALCSSVIQDGIKHLLLLFKSKASMESWEEVLALLDESWQRRFPSVLEQIRQFPTTMFSRYYSWLDQRKKEIYVTTQHYGAFLEHLADRQELTAVLALGQWKLDVSLPAQFGVLERLQATAVDLQRAVDEAKRVCSASQQIEASMEITITGDSEIREAQHTLRTQLEEALALERKQRDRSVARVQEREAYCEELEKTSHEIELELDALRGNLQDVDSYLRRRQAALQLAVLQSDVLEHEQNKGGFRIYEVDLDYMEIEVLPLRYCNENIQDLWQQYITKWVTQMCMSTTQYKNQGYTAVETEASNQLSFRSWLAERQRLFEALEELEMDEDRLYAQQKENVLLQGLALTPVPRIQLWWRYEGAPSCSNSNVGSTLLEGLKLHIRSGLSDDFYDYIPPLFTTKETDGESSPTTSSPDFLLLQRSFQLSDNPIPVPLGLGPVFFDWHLRQNLFKFIEQRLNQRLVSDLQAVGLPSPSPVEAYLKETSARDNGAPLDIPLTLFAPAVGIDTVLNYLSTTALHCRQVEQLMQHHRMMYIHYHPTGVSGAETTYLPAGVPLTDHRVTRRGAHHDVNASFSSAEQQSQRLVFNEDHVLITIVLRPRCLPSHEKNVPPSTLTLLLFCNVAITLIFGSFLYGLRRTMSGVFVQFETATGAEEKKWQSRLNRVFLDRVHSLSDLNRKPAPEDLVTLISAIEKKAGYLS